MYYAVWLCVQNFFKKYIIKVPSINLSILEEFETLNKLWHDKMYSQKVHRQIIYNSGKGPKLCMDDLEMYLHNHCSWLPGYSDPDSSHVVRLDDNNQWL